MSELTDAIEAAELRMWPAHQQPDELIAARFRVAVTAAIDAAEATIRADERAKVAEEVARAIEAKQGRRCPECQGKAGSSKPNGYFVDKRCGAGHTWTAHEHWHAYDWAAIARQHAHAPVVVNAAGREGTPASDSVPGTPEGTEDDSAGSGTTKTNTTHEETA